MARSKLARLFCTLISLPAAVAGCSPERTTERGPPTTSMESAAPAFARDAGEKLDAAESTSLSDAGSTNASSALSDASIAMPSTADASVHEEPGMLYVPGGTFTMGADDIGQQDEHPAHAVTLAAFFLDRTETTNAAYQSCVDAKVCRQKDLHVASKNHAGPDDGFAHPNQPVMGVSQKDALTFCTWKGARLPREAEFERAERGDDGRRYPWGNEKPDATRAVFARNFGADTTDDVGSHPAGNGPYGHADLAGNVWEWMSDDYDPIAYKRPGADKGEPGTCPQIMQTLNALRASGQQGFTGSNPIPKECERVIRGGAFNYDSFGLRATNRVHHPYYYRLVMTGFRCAKDAN